MIFIITFAVVSALLGAVAVCGLFIGGIVYLCISGRCKFKGTG